MKTEPLLPKNSHASHRDSGEFTPPVDNSAEIARKKLITASIICCVFMVIEIVGGLWANSLAILTDASHLLSDLCSFLISLFAIWVSTKKGNATLSFGYHRAEILGALVSVLMIWLLTGFLVYEAVMRVINPVVVDGKIMFITAALGMIANLFMTHILKMHSHGIAGMGEHEGCGHDHGHGHGHAHGHAHDHDHSHGHDHGHTHGAGCNHSHDHEHEHVHAKPIAGHDHAHGNGKCDHDHDHDHHSHGSHDHDQDHAHEHGAGCNHDHDHSHTHSHASHKHSSADVEAGKVSVNGRKLDAFGVTQTQTIAAGHSHGHTHNHQPRGNMNLDAAYIHAVGDLIQNIGVLIASAVIWWKPEHQIADPICTFLFSILVLFTTWAIIREATNVLMEGTPVGIDLDKINEDLQAVPGVISVHDLHVWSLSVGTPALAVHLVAEPNAVSSEVLAAATSVCQRRYNILHTTVQVDYSDNKKACDTQAHAKCHV